MTRQPIHCDIFCAVVDNYGDAGVCWRLARQLAHEHGWRARLWIDDPAPLRQLAPDHAGGPVEVRLWPRSWPCPRPVAETADVVIEAFACHLPPGYVEAMASRAPAPVWLNLEYLSAEDWVAGCHGLSSPDPRLPLVKHFFFPGFGEATGGLLRERGYDARREAFDEALFRDEFGIPPRAAGELTVSLFSYENPALPELMRAWAAWATPERPIRLLLPGGSAAAPASGSPAGSLGVHALPFLPQARYDELLWACDLNFVRAQWAAKPFVWQVYPQAEAAHLAKLEAFLSRHPAGAQLAAFWRAWNGQGALDWPAFAASLPGLKAPMQQWATTLAARPDLAGKLVQFCLERLK